MAKKLITVKHRGGFANTEEFFRKDFKAETIRVLNSLGQLGVDALAAATPKRTGKTAARWRYTVVRTRDTVSIRWDNDNKTDKGDSIVVLLIRGHGTRDGHYVRGNDFVTPAMKPIFEQIAAKAWVEVTK